MAYLTIIGKTDTGWATLTPELTCIGTAETREAAVEQAREAIALALGDAQERVAHITTLEQVDPDIRSEMGGEDEVIFLDPAPMNPVSLEIAQALERTGISQAELARRIGTSRSAVSRMVNPFYWGHSMDLLRRVAEALGLQIEVKLTAA